MKSLIRWAVSNAPAMNTLMIGTLLVGGISLFSLRREVFPEFELEILLVTVPYPGASPSEVEEGICQKMEEAVRSIAGIKKQTSVAREGSGFLVLELSEYIRDVQRVLNAVRSEIDRIPSFPELAEDPEIKQITLRQPAIRVNVIGPESSNLNDEQALDAELQLREIAEAVRKELLQKPSVSQANILGARDYQIDIEVSEKALRRYGLSLRDVAAIVRRENVELPGGELKTSSHEVRLRGKNKNLLGREIAKVPLITDPEGTVHTVGDVAYVRDQFVDTSAVSYVNHMPALVISVDRTANEDLLAIARDVKEFVAQTKLADGYSLSTWYDQSVNVYDRIELLSRNGIQGLILVFLVLAIFLELRLAFWVAIGIPTAVLGSAAILLASGHTLNMLSMFAFLMALGIVVDDAIVIGENIYAHRQRSRRDLASAAVTGAVEVLPAVMASVTTTIIAFIPLMFVAGIMGKFIAVLPVAVIAMLVLSLVESMFILPCHLAHERGMFFVVLQFVIYPFRALGRVCSWCNRLTGRLLHVGVERVYLPSLRWSLHNPAVVVSSAVACLLISVGLKESGITPWRVFPNIDSYFIEAKIVYPEGTPGHITDRATQRLEAALERVHREFAKSGKPIVKIIHRAVGEVSSPDRLGPESLASGSHVGAVVAELYDASQRKIHSDRILMAWRQQSESFPGAESVKFLTPNFGPGGTPIEFKILGPTQHMADLEIAVEKCKQRLREIRGVYNVDDDWRPGKWEFQLKIKDRAKAMGIPLVELAETVRASYYGAEVMRLQRGRHEVKMMVRYPRDHRRSVADFNEIRIRAPDGAELPLTELAEVHVVRGPSEITRIEQMRAITVTADVDEAFPNVNADAIRKDLQESFLPQLTEKYPLLRIRWEGEQEQTTESINSLFIGFLVATLAMFVLLTVQFRSYAQPLLILFIIPFGSIGAIWGHALLGLPLTLFSVFGFIALTGVIVNDSIVLVDFINRRLQEGASLYDGLIDAGRRRFRPVLLTTITTVAGLLPILSETSFQAQIVIPMVASLCFGLLVATVLVLLLVPTMYSVYHRVLHSSFLQYHLSETNSSPLEKVP